jgi:hypothetical protein
LPIVPIIAAIVAQNKIVKKFRADILAEQAANESAAGGGGAGLDEEGGRLAVGTPTSASLL